MNYITLGQNIFRGSQTPIQFQSSDRLRHTYAIGKTGAGKSTLFCNMALQDILNQNGICFIDPHGEAISWLLERIPKNRLEDVILFDPSDNENPVGLNLLEATSESQKDFLVGELIEIFYKLFDPEKTGIIGPQFEHWLRNASLTVMSDPKGGSLVEIPKLFTDKSFEKYKRQFIKDIAVADFWSGQMGKTSDFHKSEMLNYFSSKFGHFINNTICRDIIAQSTSGFSLENIIKKEKILLVDLSKGKIGELNSRFLGLILVSKLQSAILKRANEHPGSYPPFYLYVDEFQNMTTDTFANMLSESRKYGLGVHLTNQYFSQLPEALQDAILGNVGTFISFQIGIDDAEKLEKHFQPFKKEDLINLNKFHYYIKLMSSGQSTEAFSGISLAPLSVADPAGMDAIKKLSQLAYGKPRLLIHQQLRQMIRH